MVKDNLGDRMKEYENAYRYYLPRRLPVILRVDMRAGHTYTKGLDRPFDTFFHQAMVETAKKLCHEVTGTKLGYTQSDEISLVITNDDMPTTAAWFDNNLQKIVSIAAATTSLAFQHAMLHIVEEYDYLDIDRYKVAYKKYCGHLSNIMFDARAFILPPHEVPNYFIWRQIDAKRNSIQMVARTLYSPKELFGKHNNELQEMMLQKNVNWNNIENWKKYGSCIIKKQSEFLIAYKDKEVVVNRNGWVEDATTPVFTENRNYILDFLQKS